MSKTLEGIKRRAEQRFPSWSDARRLLEILEERGPRRFHVRTFMESEGYQRIRKGEEKGPLFKYKLGEGRGQLISAKEREAEYVS